MMGGKHWMRPGRYGEYFVVAAFLAGDSRFVARTVEASSRRGAETGSEL